MILRIFIHKKRSVYADRNHDDSDRDFALKVEYHPGGNDLSIDDVAPVDWNDGDDREDAES